MLPALLSLALSAAPAMIFHGPSDWVLTDTEGKIVSRFTKLGEYTPTDVALSPDGVTLAFVAGTPPVLYRWDGNTATRLSAEDGFYAVPNFSPDGKQIAFVHQPGAEAGPMGMHGANSNAQIYRVNLDGSGLERLTDTPGCKGNPQFARAGLILLNHNTCAGKQGLDALMLTKAGVVSKTLLPPTLSSEPTVSPDGTKVAYLEGFYENTQAVIATYPSLKLPQIIAVVPGRHWRIDLHWSADSQHLFFVSSDSLRKFDLRERRESIVSSLLLGAK